MDFVPSQILIVCTLPTSKMENNSFPCYKESYISHMLILWGLIRDLVSNTFDIWFIKILCNHWITIAIAKPCIYIASFIFTTTWKLILQNLRLMWVESPSDSKVLPLHGLTLSSLRTLVPSRGSAPHWPRFFWHFCRLVPWIPLINMGHKGAVSNHQLDFK